MLTFSINADRALKFDGYANQLWVLIKSNERYFQKFNGARANEAMLETWTHMLEHRDDMFTNPLPYMKKLARTILHRNNMEIPLSSFISTDSDEDGTDTSFVFDSLAEINEGVKKFDSKADRQSINSVLTALYLEDPESFEKLRFITESLDSVDLRVKKLFDRNSNWFATFNGLLRSYSASVVRDCLCTFFKELNKEEQNMRYREGVTISSILPVDALISSEDMVDTDGVFYRGKRYALNSRKALTSFDIDVDHVAWSALSGREVIKISLDEVMDSVADDILVEKGVNTPLIHWYKDSYIMESLSGFRSFVNTDRNAFIDVCRQELIYNIGAIVKSIVAVSDRYIYATPLRKLRFDTIDLKSKQGHRYKLRLERR